MQLSHNIHQTQRKFIGCIQGTVLHVCPYLVKMVQVSGKIPNSLEINQGWKLEEKNNLSVQSYYTQATQFLRELVHSSLEKYINIAKIINSFFKTSFNVHQYSGRGCQRLCNIFGLTSLSKLVQNIFHKQMLWCPLLGFFVMGGGLLFCGSKYKKGFMGCRPPLCGIQFKMLLPTCHSSITFFLL